jgi:quaternary ammonium compound-resistance protein SugE
MSWIILVIAGLLEVVWAIGLKYTHGFTRLTPSVITVTAMIVSIVLLSWAMRSCLWERLMPSGRGLVP